MRRSPPAAQGLVPSLAALRRPHLTDVHYEDVLHEHSALLELWRGMPSRQPSAVVFPQCDGELFEYVCL